MFLRFIYAILGSVIMVGVGILGNLIAAGIQHHVLGDQFGIQTVWELAGLALVGLVVAYWLGKPLQVPTSPSHQSMGSEKPDTVTITRLRALWSHNTLKGKGIHLRNILQLGSTLDIDTKD